MSKLLTLSMLLVWFLVGCTHHQLKESSDKEWKGYDIISTWRANGGIWITFNQDGTFMVNKGKEGKERVFDGGYNIEYSGDTPSSPLIFDCIVLKIKINNPESYEILNIMRETYGESEISIVPVSFYCGEGDPCRLKLLQLGNSFGHLLSKYFGISSQESLMLSGEDVSGEWPQYLEEEKEQKNQETKGLKN